MKYLFFIFVLIALIFYSKEQFQQSPHASYHAALLRENLDASAKKWANEANTSLQNPLLINLPYSERRLLENEHLQPVTFEFSLHADQLIHVEITPSDNTHAEVFVDIYFLNNDGSAKPVDSLATNERVFKVPVPESGRYLVRIHPSHTAAGLIDIAITSPLRYGFPVDINSNNAVQSFFGAGRDGGARRHEGIDIFAPRGTPVIAAEKGRVTRVDETPRGGKHVWVQGDQHSFYYAHLDSTAVTQSEKIERGQMLGTVGNTGNAITTNPHLHFGIYKRMRGAIDPLPLVGKAKPTTFYAPPNVELAPRWVAVNADKLNLRTGPALQYPTIDSLARSELIKVDAISGDWLRVTSSDGQAGFVSRRLISLPEHSILQLEYNYVVSSHPQKDAPVIGKFPAGQELASLGRFGEFILVQMPGVYMGGQRSQRHFHLRVQRWMVTILMRQIEKMRGNDSFSELLKLGQSGSRSDRWLFGMQHIRLLELFKNLKESSSHLHAHTFQESKNFLTT